MKFCQLCSEMISKNSGYFETWTPYHQIHCLPCHKKRRASA